MIYVLFFYSYSFIILNQNKNVPLQWHLSDDMLWCKWGTIILPPQQPVYVTTSKRRRAARFGQKKANYDLKFRFGI